jgi:ATP-dependent helicase HrpA
MAGDRVTREWFDPSWDPARGEVVARERVQLYGLTLVASRPVALAPRDPEARARRVRREALVPGQLATRGAFLAHNKRLLAEIAELEHKARRRDVLVDDETIAAFYAERVPKDVVSTATFERWRVEAEKRDQSSSTCRARR